MAHVEQLEHLAVAVGPGGAVALRDLPPAGDAGLDGQELVAGVPELVGLLERHGPGADHGQLSCEDVQELGQLVQTRGAQESPHARDARVAVDLLLALPLGHLPGGEVLLRVGVSIHVHAAELPDADGLAALPYPLLAEEGAARRVDRDRRAEGRHGDGEHGEDGKAERDVERPLERAVARAARGGGGNGVIPRRSLPVPALGIAIHLIHVARHSSEPQLYTGQHALLARLPRSKAGPNQRACA